ncbi:MAG: DUF2334 domain-containing protein [Burkholderiales bacterium]|nr:DUF2334 domain-containing protein [Burkholderiales bacterium]
MSADKRRQSCISIHDVAPATWPDCARLLAMLDSLGPLPVTLLVVPDYHKGGRIDGYPDFLRALEKRLARGDEIALHGYYHLDESPPPRHPKQWLERRVLTQNEGEFAALSASQAIQRLEWGMALMNRLGWPTPGFVSPAWLLGSGTRTALANFAFSYTTTRGGIYRLPDWQFTWSPSLVYSARSKSRRWLSAAMNSVQLQLMRDSSLLRLSLHPIDAQFDNVIAQWQKLVAATIHTHPPTTKGKWAAGASGSANPPPVSASLSQPN